MLSSTGQKGYGKEIMKHLQVFTTTPQQPQNQERISKPRLKKVRAGWLLALVNLITLAKLRPQEVNPL